MAEDQSLNNILTELKTYADNPGLALPSGLLPMAIATIQTLRRHVANRELQLQRLKDMHPASCGVVQLYEDGRALLRVLDKLAELVVVHPRDTPELAAIRARLNA